jgi:hypothetical protein
MRTRFHFETPAVVGAVTLWLCSLPALADPFDLVSQSRSVGVAFDLVATGADGSSAILAVPPPPGYLDPGLYLEPGILSIRIDSEDRSVSSPDGLAEAFGQAAVQHDSFIGSSLLSFYSTVDSQAGGNATGSAQFFSFASSFASLHATFDVQKPLEATVTMRTENLLGIGGGAFSLQLIKDGQAQFRLLNVSETRTLLLTPARYTINALLSADAIDRNDYPLSPGSDNIRMSGTFALAAIPEPETWALVLSGLGAVGIRLRMVCATRKVMAFGGR